MTRIPLGCRLVLVAGLSGALAAAVPAHGDEAAGKAVYVRHCAECHGDSGRGDGPKSKKLGFHPRDFTFGAFKCRCTPSGQAPSDADLERTIRRGLAGTPMQAYDKKLSDDEIRQVIPYLRTLAPGRAAATPPPCLSIPEPPAQGTLVTEGAHVYRILQCAMCHGTSGRADGPSAAALKDDWGLVSKPQTFIGMTKFKCGKDDRDLFRTIHTGMSGSPMPSYAAAFRYVRENASSLDGVQGLHGAAGARETSEYLSKEPDRASFDALPEAKKEEIVERRTWALVQYIRSLGQALAKP